MPIMIWGGHNFNIYSLNTTFNDVAGVYIFAQMLQNNQWKAHYIGIAESLSERLANHDRIEEAIKAGATHIHALTMEDSIERALTERMLISSFQPSLNTHHR